MRRTTIRLNDQILTEAKELAASTGRTLGGVIEDALRAALARRRQSRSRRRVALTTFHGRGLRPGVHLDDTVTLLDRMEDR